jgi:hypothetical protein
MMQPSCFPDSCKDWHLHNHQIFQCLQQAFDKCCFESEWSITHSCHFHVLLTYCFAPPPEHIYERIEASQKTNSDVFLFNIIIIMQTSVIEMRMWIVYPLPLECYVLLIALVACTCTLLAAVCFRKLGQQGVFRRTFFQKPQAFQIPTRGWHWVVGERAFREFFSQWGQQNCKASCKVALV